MCKQERELQMYVKNHSVEIINPAALPLILMSSIAGQRVADKLQVRLSHTYEANFFQPGNIVRCTSQYHTVVGYRIEKHHIVYHLSGEYRCNGQKEDVYALIRRTREDDRCVATIFSPVPFDNNGVPQLPEIKHILYGIGTMVRGPAVEFWNIDGFRSAMEEWTIELDTGDAECMLQWLKTLKICKLTATGWHRTMDAETFERSFGIKLPEYAPS